MVIKHAARTRAKEDEDEEAEKKKVEGEGWQSLPAEGSFTCRRRAAFFIHFTFAPRICRRLAPVYGGLGVGEGCS